MNDSTKKFLNKVKINTYIYTFLFMAVALFYAIRMPSSGSLSSIMLIASFAFYSIGRQVNLINDLESGAQVDTQPKAALWVRGVTWLVVMLMVLAMMFAT